jgi:ketosteroid isomerase-like protein
MTPEEARRWAEDWIEAWNRRDVDAVAAHFADDVEFCSPVAATVTGEPTGIVRGRAALQAYWSTAISRVPDLHFELDDVHLGVDCISIQYRNQSGGHVTEMAVFGPDGKVTRGWGLYDAG